MPHTDKTFKLTEDWDMQLDAEGNIILADSDYAIAQNCANEIRLWTNDAYYQADNGIDWMNVQLAKGLDATVLRSEIRAACMRVAGVQSVSSIVLNSFDTETRELRGEIVVITENGNNVTVRI
jgi:hypothetical protein